MTGGAGFGLYVHWPFCARICPYCDFNVYRNRGVDADRWQAALRKDLAYWAEQTPGRALGSLYFGGGTPSLAPPSLVAALIETADRLWGLGADAEVTLEANPGDAGKDRLAEFRAAGVNRLSLGVQSLDDAALAFLGRDHDADAARRAIAAAQETFPRVNADFIYARPGQTVDQWADELRAALAMGLSHLSLYQLTIEPGVAFGRQVAKKRWAPADDDCAADLFDATQAITAAAGLPAYEISNHARPDAQSQHNLLYWRQGDYVGIGPGAHGRLTIAGARQAIETEANPKLYLERVESAGSGANLVEILDEAARLSERLAMGLRTSEGVALSKDEIARLNSDALEALCGERFLFWRESRLVATADGRRLLDAALARLLA